MHGFDGCSRDFLTSPRLMGLCLRRRPTVRSSHRAASALTTSSKWSALSRRCFNKDWHPLRHQSLVATSLAVFLLEASLPSLEASQLALEASRFSRLPLVPRRRLLSFRQLFSLASTAFLQEESSSASKKWGSWPSIRLVITARISSFVKRVRDEWNFCLYLFSVDERAIFQVINATGMGFVEIV